MSRDGRQEVYQIVVECDGAEESIGLVTSDDEDPVAELYVALRRTGSVPLAWSVKWSVRGGDPLAAAWRASAHPPAMIAVAALAGVEVTPGAAAIARATGAEPASAAAIRKRVKTPLLACAIYGAKMRYGLS